MILHFILSPWIKKLGSDIYEYNGITLKIILESLEPLKK